MNRAAENSILPPPGYGKSILTLALAVLCFNLAYAWNNIPIAGFLIFGYAYFLIQLANQPSVRRAFYSGLAAGYACAAGQACFFWKIFHPAAIILWLVFAFWIGLFAAICCGCFRRWGIAKAVCLVPLVWTGTEYFRSELYYLKFSWLNIGYVFSNLPIFPLHLLGMYGVGFVVFSLAAAVWCVLNRINTFWMTRFIVGLIVVIMLTWLFQFLSTWTPKPASVPLTLVGVQMEFPPEHIIPEVLDQALAKNPNAPIFVMSEYTLDGGVPDSLKDWCRKHSRFLVIGGKDIVTNEVYYDTVFVVGTNGEIVFKQAKCVPIQFFKDGLPATNQDIWNSPYGKIGMCICYDFSYTRVTDGLVNRGAQLLIIPTMDVEDWGRHEHELHARVAPVRAAEYGVPLFRVASSGISQAVLAGGKVIASTSIPDDGAIISAQLWLPAQGSLPMDRFLAPFCVVVTGAIIMILLFLNWQEKHRAQK
jgi:apolipoprotein N-acyltransferase